MAQQDFTVADVLAWARTKPAEEAYNYGDNCNCAISQFLRGTGRCEAPNVSAGSYRDDDNKTVAFPSDVEEAVLDAARFGRADGDYRWTFGELVKRLETICPAPVISETWTKADAYMDGESVSA